MDDSSFCVGHRTIDQKSTNDVNVEVEEKGENAMVAVSRKIAQVSAAHRDYDVIKDFPMAISTTTSWLM